MQATSNNIEKMAMAIKAREPLPPMHCESLDVGYQIQQKLTHRIIGSDLADLKAGVTGVAVQKHLGLDGPLVASLYPGGKLVSGAKLSLVEGQELECEIGVLVDGVGKPIGLVPVVEVVSLQFSRKEDFSIANIVAANLAADRYICGETQPWDASLEDFVIKVNRNGTPVVTVGNEYSFGSPAKGAAWLVGEARKRGLWQDSDSHRLLILGTCGAPLPGDAGDYLVDYGVLGELTFTIL